MWLRMLSLPALALSLMTTGGVAGEYRDNPMPASVTYHHQKHAGLRLPHELKIMWRQEERANKKALPKEQRHGFLKAKWASMTESQKHAKIAELQSRWNALPENVRSKLLEKKKLRHEARRAQKSERYRDGGESASASRTMH